MINNNRFVWNHKENDTCNVCLQGYPTKCNCGGNIHAELCFSKEDLTTLELLEEIDNEDTLDNVVSNMPITVLIECDNCNYTYDLGPVSKESEIKLNEPLSLIIEKILREASNK